MLSTMTWVSFGAVKRLISLCIMPSSFRCGYASTVRRMDFIIVSRTWSRLMPRLFDLSTIHGLVSALSMSLVVQPSVWMYGSRSFASGALSMIAIAHPRTTWPIGGMESGCWFITSRCLGMGLGVSLTLRRAALVNGFR